MTNSSYQNNPHMSETSRLLAPSNASDTDSSKKWYFLNRNAATDAERLVEGLPQGASQEEFAPRQLEPLVSHGGRSRSGPCGPEP